MEYPEALKQVQARKPKENYMMIQFSYDNIWILPYKDGLAFMASLVNVEQLTSEYQKPPRITGFSKDAINTHVLSCQEYERYKIAELLNISIADVEAFEQPA